ncbi:MAG: hypothetical protein M3520_14575, partial [Actinomycetota bacterium]|nr:hypothetical protein [Actinomycetota bacterium]
PALPKHSHAAPTRRSGDLRINLEVHMERFIGVDDARGSLGRLVEEVATSGDVVSLTKRGRRWPCW